MRKRRNRFNMIEIVLAIGIAAFGIMAVVAMIPPALTANRDIAADAFVDEAVSKVSTYVNLILLEQWDHSSCPTTRTPMAAVLTRPTGNEVIPGFKMWPVSGSNGVYWMEASDGTPFIATLWCDAASISDFFNGSSAGQTLTNGVRIYAEISWPANRAANRQTRLFTWDVFKQ